MPRTSLLLLAVLWSLGFSGCGGGGAPGPERFQVSGTVNFDGQPLPHGSVTFDPDVSKGNSGPQGTAIVRDGRFDTSHGEGRGTVGGPMLIKIVGTTHESITEGGEGRYLFSEFVVQKDLPKESLKLDLQIPKEAAATRVKKK